MEDLNSGAPAGLEAALNGLIDDIADHFRKQEQKLMMLDQRTLVTRRPMLASTSPDEAPHQKAFREYVRAGDEDALRNVIPEEKALNLAVAGEGGYLVDPQTAERISSVLRSSSSIRQVAKVVTVESTTYDVIVDHGDLASGWATEAGPLLETDTPQVERVSIPLHELSALPKASQRLLDDAAFNIEEWLAERIADKFARAEAAAFVLGNGVDKPTGFLYRGGVPADSWSWGRLGYVATGSDGDFGSSGAGDSIVDLVYALGARYRANGTFVMNSKTTATVRKLKDADGRFLWADGLAAGEPARLLGYPVIVAEDMPDIAPDAFAIAFGDFHHGYTIAERPDLRILRDPFSAKPHVLFYATKRVGGDVSDFAAIKLLKFAAS
ncbi:MAG: phage major capsid protein [Parvularcula sp.]|nr:phage major capsid protein [Parvularcula sp.]